MKKSFDRVMDCCVALLFVIDAVIFYQAGYDAGTQTKGAPGDGHCQYVGQLDRKLFRGIEMTTKETYRRDHNAGRSGCDGMKCLECRYFDCKEKTPLKAQFEAILAKYGKNNALQSKSRGV